MKTILIIIGVIFYVAMGITLAAIDEANKYNITQTTGLNIFIIVFWPLFILSKLFVQFINWIQRKLKK